LNHPEILTANNTDKAGEHADYTGLSAAEQLAVTGGLAFRDKINRGKKVILIGKPHIDIFGVNRLLVPSVDLKMRFTLNDPKFFMNGDGNTEVRLLEADLEMEFVACMVRLRSDLFNEISDRRLKSLESVYYPTVRSEIRVYSITANETRWEETDIWNGRIPDRVILGMVHSRNYSGALTRNPFNFEKFGVKNIKQVIEGEEYPYELLEFNDDNAQLDMDGYHRLVVAGCLAQPARCMIAPEHWGHNKTTTLFMWDNVASGCVENNLMNPRGQGRVKITINKAATNHVINVIVYGEYENMLEIKPTGSVEYDIYRQQLIQGRIA
jgi:hypothetical protein